MNRKTLTALAVLGLLVIVAVAVLRQPEKGERTADRPRPLPQLKAGDFDTLAVTKNGKTTVIKKEGDKYEVTQPVKYPADENVAKQAFEAIEKLEFGNLVTEQKAKHAEFEVDDAKGVKVAIKKGDLTVGELIVGKTTGANTLVRVAGKDQVWQALGSIRYNFDRDTANWRDKTIVKFTQADAEKLEIKSPTGDISLKKESGDQWAVDQSALKIDKLDTSIAPAIISTLTSFVANDFADDAKPEQTGLDKPSTTIIVSLKGGKNVTVLVGNKKGDDDWYVKAADNPQVFIVKRYNAERINKRPLDFRDKTLCDIPEANLGEIAVSHDKDSYTLVQDKEWRLTRPAGVTLDTSKVSNIATTFKDWKATGFGEDQSSTANGLAKPKAVITARSKDKAKTCSLRIGDQTKDSVNYYALSGAAKDVYTVPKWMVDKILVKVDDLKKK